DCLAELGLDYLDLYLVHFPVAFDESGDVHQNLFPLRDDGDVKMLDSVSIVDTWKAMTQLDKKKARAVGVSNHTQEHLQALIDATGVTPAANQIERHPRLLQTEFVKWCGEKGIHITEYSTFGNNMVGEPLLIQHKTVKEIADRLNASPAQVILAWAQVGGHSVIPKSVTASRIRDNFKEIELPKEDFEKIEQIGKEERRRYNIPYTANKPRWPVNIFNEPEEKDAPHKYDNAIAPDGDLEDGCRLEEAQALRLYLDDKIDVAEATSLITGPTESSEDPGGDLPNLWGLLRDTLIELPNSQQKVVRLISNIRDLPKFDLDSRGKKRSGPLEDLSRSLWHDLPSFANQWYDGNWWYYQNEWREKPHLYSSQERVNQIANLARAEALFAQTDILGERVKYEGLSRLCDTLEDSKAVIEIEIFAVREWLLHARDLLFDMSQTPRMHNRLLSNSDIRDKIAKHEMHIDIKDERNLWQGSGGSNLERWNFWKQRLQILQGDDALDEETKKTVREALDAMR
ncbi:aldehyde reductase-like protein, partial [Aureobasidium melanogenum]